MLWCTLVAAFGCLVQSLNLHDNFSKSPENSHLSPMIYVELLFFCTSVSGIWWDILPSYGSPFQDKTHSGEQSRESWPVHSPRGWGFTIILPPPPVHFNTLCPRMWFWHFNLNSPSSGVLWHCFSSFFYLFFYFFLFFPFTFWREFTYGEDVAVSILAIKA